VTAEAQPEAQPAEAQPAEAQPAAGGALWRRTPTGTEVVLVRQLGGSWSLPQGRSKPLEDAAGTALREVLEQTGLACVLGAELPSTTYVGASGYLETVRYWAMTAVLGPGHSPYRLGPVPERRGSDELGEVSWAPMEQARARLSYAREVMVLDALQHLLASRKGGPR